MDVTNAGAMPAVTSPTTISTSGKAAISSDFETFLKMLTAQIQNQDPLSPMKSEEFAVQLATFSGVEQQVRTNELLEKVLAESNGTTLSQMASWIGSDVQAQMPVYYKGQPVTIKPEAPIAGDRHQMVIRDRSGKEVFRGGIDATGTPVTWNGMTSSGQAVSHGLYDMSVESFDKGKLVATAPASTFGRVVEAQADGDSVRLVLEGGETIPADGVTAIRSGG